MIFKRILFASVVFIGCCSLLRAEPKIIRAGTTMPNPGSYVSGAVYIASATCAVGGDIRISSKSALLSHMNVTSTATASTIIGSIGVYDIQTNPVQSTRMISSTITLNTPMSYPFNVGASSGVTVNKTDNSCVTFYYLETR